MKKVLLLVLFLLSFASLSSWSKSITIGSKKFTESYVLAEIAKEKLKRAGIKTSHRRGMGGTLILWQALKSGAIDIYPEYTGTLEETIFKQKLSETELRNKLAEEGIGLTGKLGFNNTYAILMRKEQAQKLGITKISDLKKYPALKAGFSHEFWKRKDGWDPLAEHYNLKLTDVKGLDHTLAYLALENGNIDLTDAYSTDAKLKNPGWLVLQDDLSFFPKYEAVYLYNLKTSPAAISEVKTLEGQLDRELMIRLNAEAERSKSYAQAAKLFFENTEAQASKAPTQYRQILSWTWQHLTLVCLSLFFAILIGVPLGIWASYGGLSGQIILGLTSIVQTIPSLALLALLVPIPFLGISPLTAILALFLYSLLPITRSTATGLQNISPSLRYSAIALGLEPQAQLFKIFIPLASRSILAGIKTSAIINIGTATLAALIGAGGLGEPIVSGLNLNDHKTILQGALPAAFLALIAQFLFELADRKLIPKGLRLQKEVSG